MKAASASLPDPDSPVTSTFALVGATRSASPTASRIASDNATISITILLSKNQAASEHRTTNRVAALRATDVPGRKSGALYRQIYGPRNRRNRSAPIRRFDNLRPAPREYRSVSTVRQLHR